MLVQIGDDVSRDPRLESITDAVPNVRTTCFTLSGDGGSVGVLVEEIERSVEQRMSSSGAVSPLLPKVRDSALMSAVAPWRCSRPPFNSWRRNCWTRARSGGPSSRCGNWDGL